MIRALCKHLFALWIITFLVIWFGLALLSGPATCRDGWHSSSIGKRGACSHHGGVKNSSSVFFLLALIGASGIVFLVLKSNEPFEKAERIIECLNQVKDQYQYLRFSYLNNNQENLSFQIKPQSIIVKKHSGESIKYSHFSKEILSEHNIEDVFIEGFDSVRKKNIIFHITKMNDIQIVAEYPDWLRSKWWTKRKESNAVSTDEKINSAIKNR